ncbi:H-NS family nucleoid-associated regulatory protein [Paracoccus chinensis]|uniref:H-NS histone family protein n=1 Tax=Paracoccus chinensis TaxID=525640 RepID=UPI003CCBC653
MHGWSWCHKWRGWRNRPSSLSWNPEQTWSGRGRRPQWINEALEAGRTLDDLTA